MQGSRIVFFGLIAINVALAAVVACVVFAKRREAAPSGPLEASASVTNQTRVIKLTSRTSSSDKQASPRFSWRALESTDYRRYIANLRAIECPEETIQDIIVSEVNKKYATREAALKLRGEHVELWELPALAGTAAAEKRKKLRELSSEKSALLKDLLGVELPIELPTAADFRQHTRFEIALKTLPEAKRDEVRGIQQRYWARTEELQQKTHGEYEPEDQEESMRLRRERRDALAKVLTSQEFEDLELRTSNAASSLRSQLAGFDANEKEFRELFRIRQQLDDESVTRRGAPEDGEARKRSMEVAQQAELQIKATLGEQRYADYQRSQDYNFRTLADIAQRYGLPKETAVKGYDIQKTAIAEIQRLQSQPLSPEQRAQAMTAIKAETEAAFAQTLGERGYNRYKRNNPQWLDRFGQ